MIEEIKIYINEKKEELKKYIDDLHEASSKRFLQYASDAGSRASRFEEELDKTKKEISRLSKHYDSVLAHLQDQILGADKRTAALHHRLSTYTQYLNSEPDPICAPGIQGKVDRNRLDELINWKDSMENEMRARIAQFNAAVDRIRAIETVLQMPAPNLETAVSRGKTHDPVAPLVVEVTKEDAGGDRNKAKFVAKSKSSEELLDRIASLKTEVEELKAVRQQNEWYQSRIQELADHNNELLGMIREIKAVVEDDLARRKR